MFTINIDADEIMEKIEGMQQKIQHLDHHDILDEVRDWETQDVNRKLPGARRARHGARVTFRPHSRYEMLRSRRARRRLMRKGRYLYRVSTRPILRQVMIDRLTERMNELLVEKLRWGS